MFKKTSRGSSGKRNLGRSNPRGPSSTVINSTAPRRQKISFFATGGNAVVTRASLLSIVTASSGVSSSPLIPLYTSVRVVGLKITVPGIPATATTNLSVQVIVFQWLSDLGKQDRLLIRNTGSLGTKSRYLRPPPQSRAAMWSVQGAQTTTLEEVLFQFNVNGDEQESNMGYFVDVDLEFLTDSASGASIAITTTPSIGVYYAALDNLSTGLTVGTWKLLPLGVDEVVASKPSTYTRSGG